MGHNSRYQKIQWRLAEPIEGVNNDFSMWGQWRTSAVLSNTFIDVPTIKQTQQWIDQNAEGKFIIVFQDNMVRLTNETIATLEFPSADKAIRALQALLDLSKIPEPVILDLETIQETDPVIQAIIEGTEPTQLLQEIISQEPMIIEPIQKDNTLRNALLIAGVLLIL